MVRAVGPVLLQAHNWVWLTGSVKSPKPTLPKELGWERGVLLWPSMVICRGSTGGAAGGMQKGPSGTKGKTRTRTGKKGKNCMSTRGDQREEATEGVLLSFWARKGPRAQLCTSKRCLGWQEQLAQLGPRSPLRERVSHFQITTPLVLLSTGAQWYGPLDAAGIKARVQKISVFS